MSNSFQRLPEYISQFFFGKKALMDLGLKIIFDVDVRCSFASNLFLCTETF